MGRLGGRVVVGLLLSGEELGIRIDLWMIFLSLFFLFKVILD